MIRVSTPTQRPIRLKITAVTLAVAALAVSGCATPQRCPMTGKDGYCASMKDTYAAARANAGGSDNVLYGSDAMQGDGGESEGKDAAGRLDVPGGRHLLAGPVYRQAKPYRLWVAPWTDANGIVHSGEYLYFTTPGSWSYGPLDMPGSAAGVMGPVAPDDLGFQAVEVSPTNAATRGANGAGGNRADQNNGQAPDPADPNSITRPAVRLGNGTDLNIR